MADHRPQFGELESYLDGQMSGEMRARFEDQLARDPSLRDAIAQQRSIDESLKRTFAVSGGAEAILAQLMTTAPSHAGNGRVPHEERITKHQSPRTHRFIRPRLAIAAAIVFLL